MEDFVVYTPFGEPSIYLLQANYCRQQCVQTLVKTLYRCVPTCHQ